mgnify:FL=1|tara:strand:- start:2368 stop:2982 length:615 start_codon:yes stop_codon:yes gene_type:complete
MSTTSSGYGFVPVKRSDGMPYAGAQESFLITPAGVAQNIGYGSIVEINAGYVQLASGTGADATTNNLGGSSIGALGVFVGCEYINAQGQLIFSQYYPSGTDNATAFVITDPSVTFQVQADGAIAQAALGHNAPLTGAQHATTSVDTVTGKSNIQLDATTATATKSFKVVGFVTKPGSAIGDAYTDVLVKINSPYHQFGTGIVGE